MQTIVLPISPAYIDHWDLAQGIKELVSNCSDSVNRDRNLMEFFTNKNEDGTVDLTIGNKIVEGKLEPKHLVLGVSENRNKENAIGQFGEGMKLAFITLLRNKIDTFVENDDERWVVSLAHDETFGTELPHIHITNEEPTGHVRFHLKGLDAQTVVNVMSMVWEFLPEGAFEIADEEVTVRYLHDTDEDFAGLFVGGIFMGELHPRFAINTLPVGIPVNRDRKLPDDLELVKERISKLLMEQFDFSTNTPQIKDETPLLRGAFVQLMETLGLFCEYEEWGIDEDNETVELKRRKNDINMWFSIAKLERTFNATLESLRNTKFCSDYNTCLAKGYKYVSWDAENRLRRIAKAEAFRWAEENIITAAYQSDQTVYNDLLTNVYAALKEAGMEQEAAKAKTKELLDDLRVHIGQKEKEVREN